MKGTDRVRERSGLAFSGRALRFVVAASLVATAVVVGAQLPVSAATTTFTATADAMVQEANASTAYGTTTALRVDAGTDPDVETYLRFAVTGLSGTVQTATLRLWATSATANGPAVYTTANTWSESAITWGTRTTRVGSGVDDKASIPTGAWVEFNVTSLVPGNGDYNFVLAGTSTDGVDFQSREATNKPQLVVTTTTTTDTQDPTPPSGLGAVATSATRVDLTWTASTDDTGVTGYEIFRNGSLLTTIGAVTTYADTSALPNTTYSYQVRGLDAANHRSTFSNAANATTPAVPTTTTFSATADAQVQEANASTNYGTSTTLRVDAGTDPDVESYLRFPVSGLTGTVQTATLRLWVGTDGTANGPAVFTTAGTWSESAITWTNRTPRVGAGVDDKASIPTNAWVEYNVTSLVTGNGSYDFVLAGTSTDGINFSSREATTNKPQLVIATTAGPSDTENPSDPSGLSALPTSGTRVDLSWTASTDNNVVTNYEIYRNGALLTTVAAVTSYADTTVVNATTYDYKLKAVDGAGNHSSFSNIASVTTPDTASPSNPGSLNATAFSSTRVDLTWTASTDNVGVTNYEIYRGNVLVTTVGAVTSYSDTPVSPSTPYAYKLKAVDAAGNHSDFSNTSSVTTPATPDGEPPSDITDLSATAVSATGIDLSWTGSNDNVGVTNYEIYRGGVLLTTVGNVTTYADLTAAPSTPYSYQVKARDAANNHSGFSNTATATTPADTDKPTTPTNLGATVVNAHRVDLSWTASTDNVGVTNYKIYRNGSLLTTVGTVTSFQDTTASSSTPYDYVVVAIDAALNASDASNTASVATPDGEPPSDITDLSATAVSATGIDLSWTGSNDNVGVTNYEIYRGGVLLTTVGNVTTYADLTAAPSTPYSYQVKARDAANNHSGFSNTATATTPADTDRPTTPTNLGATVVNAHRVDLSWTASTDNVGVTHYEISRNGTVLTTVGNVTSYSDTTTASSASYDYAVTAIDAALNASDPSNTASVTTPDGDGPTDPASLTATPISGTQIDLSWTASTDNQAVIGYDIYRGGVVLTSVGVVTSFSDTTVINGTQYQYKVKAFDAAGNRSGFSNTAIATTPDTQDPNPPSNLVATVITSTRVDLTWTAGSDNVGVTNYEIYRGGVLLTTVGNVTTYSDTSVLAGVTYSYQVRAMDATLHRSTFSNTATVTTTDLAAPSNPTNLLATAVAYNRIDLTWTASTDNVAVTNYEIYRGGILLTTVGAVTSYSDVGLTPGTAYLYQVKAMDLAANRSGFSNSSSATTPQQVVTLLPTADAHVDEATPTTNFGTATALRADAGTGVKVESYLLFTASGLAGTLRHATLRVWASSGTADGPAVYTSPTNWTETGITWSTRPTRTTTPTDDKAGISTGTWVEYDVTTLMTGNGTWSYVLAGVSTDGVDFHSKEGANDPQLVITMGATDTQAPTSPTLSGSASSPTQVDLSWTSSTDDVAVTGYDVYRGTTLIASLGPVNTYSDTTVSANTTYSYTVKARDRAGNVSGASNTLSLKTPTSGGTSPTIAIAGDIACANTDAAYNGGLGTAIACQQLATSNLLINAGYSAVMALGDNQYNSGSLAQFNAVYNPTWGRVKSITHPVIGNHEYGTSNASGYFTYFGSSAGDPTKGYYSFNVGSWHVVSLNSNCTIVACDAGSAQEQWFRSDLSANPAACTIVMTHHARWSSGHDGDNVFLQALWQDMVTGGVDVLLSGHSHNYERFAPQNASGGLDNTNGVRQFVVGTGGAFFTGVGTAHANSQVRNNDTFGILKMTLRPTGYDWQFIRAAGGTFTDSGSTACH